jgi:hypothetical protein
VQIENEAVTSRSILQAGKKAGDSCNPMKTSSTVLKSLLHSARDAGLNP